MCACDFNFVCARCAAQWPLDLNPLHIDAAELDQERVDMRLSMPDFIREGGGVK